MSTLDSKNLNAPEIGDNVARAKLFNHLAHKGWMVLESDHIGPLRVLVNSMSLQEWKRIQKVSGDYDMELVSSRVWKYDR